VLHEVTERETELLVMLFPQLRELDIVSVEDLGEDGIVITARTRTVPAPCRRCGLVSACGYDSYARRLRDLACSGRAAGIAISVRRFCCADLGCAAKTFAGQVPGLTSFYRRCSQALQSWLSSAGLELGGRAGARVASASGIPVSRHALARAVAGGDEPEAGPVRILGVDDVAIRRGRDYATILIDIETGKVTGLLPGRDAAPSGEWLRAHPGIEVICRDRGTACASAARAAAPGAIQVADRFHLEKNLSEAVDATVRALLPGIEPAELRIAPREYRTSHGKDSTLAGRHFRLHPLVKELRAAGLSLAGTARELGISEPTARKYDEAATPEELLVKATRRRSALDPWKPCLAKRRNEGETAVTVLDKEIREQGWTGSINLVYRHVRQFRTADGRDPAGKAARKRAPESAFPEPGEIARQIMSHPCNLGTADAASLQAILDASPELRTARALVLAFHDMTGGLRGQYLDDWIAAARRAPLPALHSFADGLERDIDAVRNGLTLPWSSGPVEGKNCKFKHIKRLMYGRASFAFLRRMILGR
jgi:transposase